MLSASCFEGNVLQLSNKFEELKMKDHGFKTILFIMFALLVGLSAWYSFATVEVVEATIKKSERISQKSNAKYMVFTKDEVFENSDSAWHGKYNSSDFYNELSVGKTYKFTVYGYRIPIMSSYRNIISFEEINTTISK